MAERVFHIDVAKGISIILVALYHSKLKVFAPHLMSTLGLFRLPLFFFLSGIFFNIRDEFGVFVRKKSDALLKPYFITVLLVVCISAFFVDNNFIWQLKGIFYGNGNTIEWTPLWFLPHLWAVFMFAYLVFRLTHIQNQNIYIKALFLLTMITIGYSYVDFFWQAKVHLFGQDEELPGLPFSTDIIFISGSFFILGSFLRTRAVVSFKPAHAYFILSLVLFAYIALFTDASIDLNDRVYSSLVFSTLGALTGIYAVLYASFYICRVAILRDILLAFGKASLFILIFHSFISDSIYDLLTLLESDEYKPVFAVVAFIASITLPLFVKKLAASNRLLAAMYFPIGARR